MASNKSGNADARGLVVFSRGRIVLGPGGRKGIAIKNRQTRARFSLMGVAILLSLFSSTAVRAQTRIRLATLLPQGTSQYRLLEAMGQQWRPGTNGALSLTINAGETMGSEKERISHM